MRIGECQSCQFGDHRGHVRNYAPVPEGMFGGAMCPCKGECDERGPTNYIKHQLEVIASCFRKRPRA